MHQWRGLKESLALGVGWGQKPSVAAALGVQPGEAGQPIAGLAASGLWEKGRLGRLGLELLPWERSGYSSTWGRSRVPAAQEGAGGAGRRHPHSHSCPLYRRGWRWESYRAELKPPPSCSGLSGGEPLGLQIP